MTMTPRSGSRSLVPRRVSRAAGIAAGLALAAVCAAAQEFPRGQVVPRVTCRSDGRYSYALYLPVGYAPDRKWPVLFCFSPDGRGDDAVLRFRALAERFGYILVGSLDSSNAAGSEIVKIEKALWDEVEARFPMDPRRAAAAGFSGGGRAALCLALSHPDRFEGVVTSGAFDPEIRKVPPGCPLSLYLLVGCRDFNLFEMTRAEKQLTKLGVAHWYEEFAGDHRWPPEALLGEGLEYLQLTAMRRGTLPDDPAFAARLLASRADSAAALSASGLRTAAWRKYRQTAALFRGLPGAAAAAARAAELEQDPEVQERLALEPDFEALRERVDLRRGEEALLGAMRAVKRRGEAGGLAADFAALLLRGGAAQLGDVGGGLFYEKEYGAAARVFDQALEFAPGDALLAYNGACAYARLGDRKGALRRLEKAVANGFRDADGMARDPDLESLRGEPGFQELLARMRSGSPVPPRPP